MVDSVSHARPTAGDRDLDLSGHLAGDLYIKARAEASGLRGDGGFIERPERLIIVLTGAGVSDFPFVPWPPALSVGMWLLAVASVITCVQRLHTVWTSPEPSIGWRFLERATGDCRP